MKFHEKIKVLRKLLSLKQLDVAKVIGIQQSGYAKYETARFEPDRVKMQKLATLFNVTLDYLTGQSEYGFIVNLINANSGPQDDIVPEATFFEMLDEGVIKVNNGKYEADFAKFFGFYFGSTVVTDELQLDNMDAKEFTIILGERTKDFSQEERKSILDYASYLLWKRKRE